MKKTPEIHKLTFKAWYHSLNREQQAAAMARITTQCITKKTTVYNWLYGNCAIPPLAQPIVNKIAGQQLDYTFIKSENKISKTETEA